MAGEIFISYRRADAVWARLLYDHLRAEGIEAWYDAQVGAGQDWRIETARALEASQIFVLLFSENAAQSSDIAKELAAAVLEKKLIVPVRLAEHRTQGGPSSTSWLRATGSMPMKTSPARLAELAKGLAHLVRTGAKDENVLPFARTAERPLSARSRAPLVAGAVVVVAVAALAALLWLRPATRRRPPSRLRPRALRFCPSTP